MPLSNSYSVGLHRSNHRRYSKEKGFLKNFKKRYVPEPFFNKVAGLRSVTSLKMRLRHRWFPVNFVKRLRTSVLKNICEWLVLVAGWATMKKLSSTDLWLLTCLVYINISVASSFSFFSSKLTKGKLYRELRLVLKYNFKERDWIVRLRRQIWSCGIGD